MGIFVRTLIITLVFCLGYFVWTYFAKEGYSPELQISKEAKNTLVQEKGPNTPNIPNSAPETANPNAQTPDNPAAMQVLQIPMLTNDGNIKYVTRKAKHKTLYTALGLLLKGPTEEEIHHGIFTEIPKDARLISVKRNEAEGTIIINLTKEFGEGGGTQSVLARLNQIVKTADLYGGKSSVYLYLDGKKAQYLGGEGIYINQPINK